MDEKQLLALYDSMRSTMNLGDFNSFKGMISSDEKYRKAFYDTASATHDIGDYNSFSGSFKKKDVSVPVSSTSKQESVLDSNLDLSTSQPFSNGIDPEELKKRYEERVGSGTGYLNYIIDQKRSDPNYSRSASNFIRTAKDLNAKGLRPERTSLVYNFFGNDISKDSKARDSFISSSYAGTYYSEAPELKADYEKSDLKNVLTPRQYTGLKSLSFGKESEYQDAINKLKGTDGPDKEIVKLDLDKIGIDIDQDAAASMFNQNRNVDIASNIYSKAKTDSQSIEDKYRQIDYESPYTLRSFGNIIKGAVNRGLAVGNTADILTATSNESGIDVDRLASLQKEMQDAKASRAYEQFSNDPSFENFKKNPIGIMLELGLESLTALYSHGSTRMAAGAATGATMGSVVPGIGTAAGASSGVIAGMGMASLNLEYSSKILEGLSNLGVNTTDAESLRKAFADEKLMSQLKTDGLKKGIPVAIFDMLSAGLAGKIVSKPAKSIVGKVLQGAAETGVQAGLGAAGEASGQLVSEGKISSPNAVLMEAIGELGPGAVEIAYGNMVESAKRNKPISTKDAVTVASGDKKVLKQNLDAQVASGNLTKDQAASISGEISKTESNLSKIPQDLSTTAKADVLGLVEKKSQLVEQSKNLDDAFKPQVDQQIKQIDEQILSITQKDRNAINESIVQEGPTEGNLVQPARTKEGQQEEGQGTGAERQGQIPQTNVGDSNIGSQGQVAGQELSKIERITPESIEVSSDATDFAQQMESAQSSLGRMGMSVSPYAQEDYDQIASEGGKFLRAAGNKVLSLLKPNGEMVSLVKDASVKAKGAAQAMISRMKDMGGLFMDNYDIYLTPIYEKAGYKVVARVPFNEQYAPEGWNAEDSPLKNKPDVVFMVRNDIAPEQAQTFTDYEEAQNYTQGLVDQAVKEGVAKLPTQMTKIDEALGQAIPKATQSLQNAGIEFQVVDAATDTEAARAARGNQGLFVSEDGTIIIDRSKLADDIEAGIVVWHEASHPVMNIIRNTNKPLYNSVVRGLQKAAKTNDGVAKALFWAKSQPEYDNVDTQNDEAVVETIARINSGLIDVSKLDTGLRQKLVDFVNAIAKYFGINPILDDTDIAAFKKTVSQVADALKTGRDIGEIVGQENVGDFQNNRTQTRAVTIAKGTESMRKYGLKEGKNTTRKIGEALEKRTREKLGIIGREDRSESAMKKISSYMADEVRYFIEQFGENSGKGWYGEKFQKGIDAMSKIFPEFETDQNARDLFTMLVAVTSDGTEVMQNFKQASMAYQNFKDTGKMPTEASAQRSASYLVNFKNIQDLLDKYNGDIAAIKKELLKVSSISDLNKERKGQGLEKLKTSWPAGFKVPLAASIFGPKLGMFYANLSGMENYPTLDRWWSRTFNRYRGTLIPQITRGFNKKGEALGIDRYKQIAGLENASEDEIIAKIIQDHDTYEDKGFKKGTDAEKAANTLYKKLFIELNDAPFGAKDREFMYDTFVDAKKKLKTSGINVTIADIQAILWYFEKNLYKKLGVTKPIQGISYEDAALKTFDKWSKAGGSFDYNIEKAEEGDTIEEIDEMSEDVADQASVGNRGELLAPNGKPSNLTPKQYEQVRTPQFKNWFGDWENDPANASKVVDENGEPLVVYHGSVATDIEIFDRLLSKRESSGLKEMGIYFTTNKNLSELYAKAPLSEETKNDIRKQIDALNQKLDKVRSNREFENITSEIDALENKIKGRGGKVYEAFLNLRKVKEFDAKGKNGVRAWDNLQVDAGYKIAQNRDAMDFLMNGKFGVEQVDGIIARNIADIESYGAEDITEEFKGTVYLVFDDKKNSIKSATDNTGEFSTTDNRIQASVGNRTEDDLRAGGSRSGRIQPAPLKGKETKKLKDIIFDVVSGTKQKTIYTKTPRALGSYNPSMKAVKIRYEGDLDTTAHEIGHSIDDEYGIMDIIDSNQKAVAELAQFSPFGSKPPKGYPDPKRYIRGEGFAEFLRAYMVNPDAAKSAAPELSKILDDTLPDGVKKSLDTFSDDIRAWAGSSAVDQIAANVQIEPEKGQTLLQKLFLKKESGDFSVNWVDRLGRAFLDSLNVFDKAISHAKGLKGIDELKPSKDPIILARLLNGFDAKFGDAMKNGMFNSKLERITTNSGDVMNVEWLVAPLADTDVDGKPIAVDKKTLQDRMKKVISYMIAERTVELSKRFNRKSILSGIGAGVFTDVNVAERAISEIESDPDFEKIKEAAIRYREMADETLKYMVNKGRIANAEYDKEGNLVGGYEFIKKNNLQYVAMQRIFESEPGEIIETGLGGSGSIGSKTDVLKKIKGSSKAIVNPYIPLIENVYKSYKESDRNEILKSFRDLLVDIRMMGEGSPVRFSDIGTMVSGPGNGVVTVFVDGKPEYWKFQTDIYNALKNLDSDGYKLPGVLTALPRALRWSVTNFPVFAIRNFIRDFQHRAILSGEGNPIKNVTSLFHSKDAHDSAAKAGALNAGHYMMDRNMYYGLMGEAVDKITKNGGLVITPDALKSGWEKYGNLLYKSENVNRIAQYQNSFDNAKAKGMNDYDASLYAASKSRGLIDFAVAGHIMKIVNQMIPFSNAAVQGLRSSAKNAAKDPAGFAGRIMLYSVLPQVAFWMLNHRDDDDEKEYENLPDYQRDMFYNVKIGDNKWLSIPKPFELGLVASAIDRAMSYAKGFKKSFDGYAGSVAKAIFPFDDASMAGPLQKAVEVKTNYDFFRDQNIIPPHEMNLRIALRNTETASRLGKILGKISDSDPRMVDHFIRGQFSYFGNVAMKVSDIGRDNTRNKFDISDTGVMKKYSAYTSKPVQEFLTYSRENGLTRTEMYQIVMLMANNYFNEKDEKIREQKGIKLIETTNKILDSWKSVKMDELMYNKMNAGEDEDE